MVFGDGLDVSVFARRRERVLEALEGAVALVLAGDGAAPLIGAWTADWNFAYLTGIRNEQGAALLLDPQAEDPKRRCMLFLKPLNPEVDEWDGYRERIGGPLRKATGFETVMRTSRLAMSLTAAARKRGRLACLHPFAVYDAPVSPDLALFKKVAERVPGVRIEDRTDLLPGMRAVKSEEELAQMRRAIEATAAGHEAAMGAIRPGVNEREVQWALESAFRAKGASGPAYNSIVGGGLNGTVLHYTANDAPLREGELLVIDAGARFGAYCADVTRTYPVSGAFTAEQREVYEVVLAALEAATRAAKPGVWMHEVDAAAREVIEKAGYGDAFMHGVGHQLGMEVHDVTPDGPLRAGMVVTIEPGIYLPAKRMGIRVEDDVLVTPRGGEALTGMIPKGAEEVEAAMRRALA